MCGATGAAIDQGKRPAAVNNAQRIEDAIGGIAEEERAAISYFGEREAERAGDRGWRMAAVQHVAQTFEA